MTKGELLEIANRFRMAILRAKNSGEFKPEPYKREPMNDFPNDCCDDATDLFIHYIYHNYGIDSIKITGNYYSNHFKCSCYHTWQETEGFVVDLTGDQFDNDTDISVKSVPVYVGKKGRFHNQFSDCQSERSCGIECLGEGSWERMYRLYDAIMKYIN
jgi:hypothetical protein